VLLTRAMAPAIAALLTSLALTGVFSCLIVHLSSLCGRTIRLQRAVDSPLFRKKRTATDPEFCEGLEILLVSAGDCVFLPAFNAKSIFSRRVLLDL